MRTVPGWPGYDGTGLCAVGWPGWYVGGGGGKEDAGAVPGMGGGTLIYSDVTGGDVVGG